MSDFKDKCGDVLTGAAIGALGGPVISSIGSKIGGAIGTIAALLSN